MQFQPGSSPLHRLHPLVKLAWLFWVTVAVFLFGSVTIPVAAVVGTVALLWLAGTPPWRLPGLRLWLTLGVLVLATHTLTGGTAGWLTGLRIAGRLLAVILCSALFVATTDPVTLVSALMRVGLPYRWGFALATALRLAPVFRGEAHQVYRAQLVRGVAYDSPGPRRWWLLLRYLCLPLLVSALRTAQSLSLSMEGRAFGLHPTRTFVRRQHVGPLDGVALTLLAVTLAAAIIYAVVQS